VAAVPSRLGLTLLLLLIIIIIRFPLLRPSPYPSPPSRLAILLVKLSIFPIKPLRVLTKFQDISRNFNPSPQCPLL
jgi:hypothetical protein